MFSNIMVSYDGSDLADKALEMGIELAQQNNAKLHVFHVNVISTNLKVQAINSPSLQAVLDGPGEKVIAKAEERVKSSGCEYAVHVESATSAPKPIMDYANTNGIDLIVMGSRGLGTVKQYFGSVSHAILNVSKIPVLIIKS